MLVLVQELTSSDGKVQPPSRSLEDYSINELKTLTLQYAKRFDQRRRRQAPEEQNGVYIAANITEELMESEFILGDGLEYGVYTNHPLTAGVFYNVVLRGAVDGTDTPLFANASDPIMGQYYNGIHDTTHCVSNVGPHLLHIWKGSHPLPAM